MKHKLLIVDDEPANLRLLDRLFSRDFECLTASSGAEAMRLLEQHDIAILITDQRMPQMTGIDLLKHTARLRPHMVRILLTGYTDVEVLVDAINSGLVYTYVTKPWNNDDLKLKINRAREHYENNKKSNALALANDRLLRQIKEMKLRVVTALSEMMRTRDEHAYTHAVRVCQVVTAIAEKTGVGEDDKEDLSAAALLHHLADAQIFGRAASGRTDSITKQITGDGAPLECEAHLLASLPELARVVDFIKLHRENFDGTGSPDGLAGEQIPLASRILRVGSEYDLLLQPESSVAITRHDEAMRSLLQRSGKQFDPDVIKIMAELTTSDLDGSNIAGGGEFSVAQAGLEPVWIEAIP
jgi:response regulator RpfG family c-di-GMP phosphodiesterase